MKSSALPKYNVLHKALGATALKLHPSQVHGLICGILCGNPNNTSAWEELVTGGEESGKTHELLQQLYDASAQQLKEFLFDFTVLLPSDDVDLTLRAEALTVWCQGFLTGLKLAQINITEREPSDITEAINDLIEIAKMNYEEVVASEEDEEAYAELVEFVRMAVILIYQDLRDAEKASNKQEPSTPLH